MLGSWNKMGWIRDFPLYNCFLSRPQFSFYRHFAKICSVSCKTYVNTLAIIGHGSCLPRNNLQFSPGSGSSGCCTARVPTTRLPIGQMSWDKHSHWPTELRQAFPLADSVETWTTIGHWVETWTMYHWTLGDLVETSIPIGRLSWDMNSHWALAERVEISIFIGLISWDNQYYWPRKFRFKQRTLWDNHYHWPRKFRFKQVTYLPHKHACYKNKYKHRIFRCNCALWIFIYCIIIVLIKEIASRDEYFFKAYNKK